MALYAGFVNMSPVWLLVVSLFFFLKVCGALCWLLCSQCTDKFYINNYIFKVF